MSAMKVIIDSAINILTIEINLLGYEITLMNVAVYGIIGSIILWFIFRLFR